MTLTLEPLRDEDSDALFAWINDPELVELSAVFRPVSRPEHDLWFARVRTDPRIHAVALREDGRLVGSAQLIADDGGEQAELRIRIGERDAQGRGLGTEAVERLVEDGLTRRGLRRIWLQVFAANTRAIRAYEKAGFTASGGAGEGDVVIMSLDHGAGASVPSSSSE